MLLSELWVPKLNSGALRLDLGSDLKPLGEYSRVVFRSISKSGQSLQGFKVAAFGYQPAGGEWQPPEQGAQEESRDHLKEEW